MPRLPPPPRFTLSPPPMPPSDIFDRKLISQLTCSSIRQHGQETILDSHLIFFASATVIAAILLFIITLIWLLSSRKQKQSYDNSKSKPSQVPKSIESMNDLSTCSTCSYETVSPNHTGIYLESVDTSATTCSTDVTTSGVCYECYQHHDQQSIPYYHVICIPDVVPN
ncbi:unnamed protein product [Adineta steineri]|uniref:Uncharacterized protein n=1 Tax=Adineta steineri TaxID=433720 RepID=A0A813PRK8_9BILA|nr:unnamed protein product [Adineta steineri]CAF0756738.1 unnamed protein product [Adineta steineri]CAF0866449.1 unnamed protein product [Adineta steineri]